MSLRLKMILGIGLILALVIVEYAVFAVRTQAGHQMSMARREAELIGRVAERAISIAMEQGKSEEIQRLLERIGSDREMARIRIIDTGGRILRSSDAREVGRTLPAQQSPPKETSRGSVWDRENQTVQIFDPIRNEPRCFGCHPRDRTTLGLLNVRVSLLTGDAQMNRQLRVMVLSGVIGLIAAGVLMELLFTVVVGRRIDALTRTMQQVEVGELTAHVPDASTDELGRLGKSFNAMVDRLAAEQKQREARHAEEIRQTEQMASLGKMAAVGTITSGIAHELNNPLNNISLTTEALMEDFKALSDDQRWRLLQDIYFEVERASEIVRSLLDFTRQEKPEMVPVVILELVQSTHRLVANEMALSNVIFLTDVPVDLPRVRGAPNQLRQVLLNLFLNSIQAMPRGGTLRVKALRSEPGFVRIDVQDDGVGIAAENLPHIFDPFFTTKEPGKGSGLGLWVTYGIIRKHGGEIRASSEPGKGSAFHVILPAAEP